MTERYFVDIRGGCVAVRDRTKTNPEYPGLHDDTEGVMRFWSFGRSQRECPTCGRTIWGWASGDQEVCEAFKLCDRLNGRAKAAGGSNE